MVFPTNKAGKLLLVPISNNNRFRILPSNNASKVWYLLKIIPSIRNYHIFIIRKLKWTLAVFLLWICMRPSKIKSIASSKISTRSRIRCSTCKCTNYCQIHKICRIRNTWFTQTRSRTHHLFHIILWTGEMTGNMLESLLMRPWYSKFFAYWS